MSDSLSTNSIVSPILLKSFPPQLNKTRQTCSLFRTFTTSLLFRPGCVPVMGNSASGNLAAVVCLIPRGSSGPLIAFRVLIYPTVDLGENFPPNKAMMNAGSESPGAGLLSQFVSPPGCDLKDPLFRLC